MDLAQIRSLMIDIQTAGENVVDVAEKCGWDNDVPVIREWKAVMQNAKHSLISEIVYSLQNKNLKNGNR